MSPILWLLTWITLQSTFQIDMILMVQWQIDICYGRTDGADCFKYSHFIQVLLVLDEYARGSHIATILGERLAYDMLSAMGC
uniref:Uncharacterized protein n=1 Tax=Thermosporothrix sp. COM3 TaxID=2490863 RepID=A0A455SX39_9CHLR|nr:hypothetical protein KTC_64400 [Thermosporothrix sp. COM3]